MSSLQGLAQMPSATIINHLDRKSLESAFKSMQSKSDWAKCIPSAPKHQLPSPYPLWLLSSFSSANLDPAASLSLPGRHEVLLFGVHLKKCMCCYVPSCC